MSLIELTFTAIVMSGLAGGSITVLGPMRLLSSIYITSLLLPYAILGFTLQIEGFVVVSVLALAFWSVMMITSKKSSEFVSSAIQLQVENENLLEQLQVEKVALEKSNVELLGANEQLDEYSLHLQKQVDIRTKEIFRISNLDPLTQLLNRSAFLKYLQDLFAHNKASDKQYALYFIDLNGFKGINDSLGHAHGDSVLSEIAQRLTHLSTQHFDSETILSRWGGDEFIFVCEFATEEQSKTTAEQIVNAIEKPIVIDVDQLSVSASIGVAVYPQHSIDTHELIQFADLAMYHCKNSQSTQALFYTSGLMEAFLRQQRLRKGLSNAIEYNELFLVFQPIIDIEKNLTFAFEALLRWRFNDELVGPDEFIPIAEKTGLILDIGYWVVDNAIKEFCQLDNFQNYKLSINISRVQIMQPNFAQSMLTILASYPIDNKSVHFEITETTEVEDRKEFNKVIRYLYDGGISISVDDFGTGYSSLEQLQALNFDVIKIDRSFITNLNKKDVAIISAAYFIAEQFDAITIVEGVETEHQLAKLKSLGFRYIQGFFFAKPMTINEIQTWRLSNKKNATYSSFIS
jgi:diguanylate cyclase (GGDEF)-like protein